MIKPRLQFAVVAGFIGILFVLLVVSAISYYTTIKMIEDAGWVTHTERAKTRLATLLSTTTDIETGARGFVISGEQDFLDPAVKGMMRVDNELDALGQLTADNPKQVARLQVVRDLIGERISAAKTMIEIFRNQGYQSVVDSGIALKGKEIHDRLRLQIREMTQEEDRLLALRNSETNDTAQLNVLVTLAGGVGTVLLGAMILVHIYRGFAERQRSEQAMLDLTERLRVALEKAQAADRVKSAFLATMSHELRTPLNSIIGFTGILLQSLAGPLNPEQCKQLTMVRNSGRHLLALINDVLDISKIEAGELQVANEPFALRASIDKVVGIITPLAEKKGLTVACQLPSDLDDTVGDARRVEQVLLNLLSNAVKFTDQGQVVLTAEIVADFKPPAGGVAERAIRLRIDDSGPGIKPEDLATLFQPFRQLDSGLQRNHEGTGLGLSICRRLAELMGGDVRAESEWGKGSTFTFTLPLKGAA